MKRLSPKDEDAAVTLLQSGNAVVFFTPEEMSGINADALMAAVTAAGFQIIFEAQRGERCLSCLNHDCLCPAEVANEPHERH